MNTYHIDRRPPVDWGKIGVFALCFILYALLYWAGLTWR